MKFSIEFFLTILLVQIAASDIAPNSSVIKANEKETVIVTCSIDLTSANLELQDPSEDEDYDTTAYEDELERKKRTLPVKRQSPVNVIQWFKDTVKLNKYANLNKYEQDGSVLRILNAEATDSGNYTCKLINGQGSTSSSIQVEIEKLNATQVSAKTTSSTKPIKATRKKVNLQRSPVFLNTDKNYKFQKQKGDEVKFSCKASGVPKPDILWYKNGEVLTEEEYGITRSKWSLYLKDLRLDDNGNFTCQVFNKYGSINATDRKSVV